MTPAQDRADLEALELQLLLEGVYRRYGYDFRDYSRASLTRRIWNTVRSEGLTTISGLQERVLHDPAALERLLLGVSVHVSSMFRDPEFFRALRIDVVPLLRDRPLVRVWNAGCSTGEETYSIAILLREEGLADRSRIYATDISAAVLERAKTGAFPLHAMREYTHNYQRAGGGKAFSEYYTAHAAGGGQAVFDPTLRDNVVFSAHNLAADGSFNEFDLILCRNVMIYFARPLQHRVHHLLYDSLASAGVLGLGSRESLAFTPHQTDYRELVPSQKIYRRVR